MKKVFKFFASIRFAIPWLSLFTAAMIWGTVQESRFGAEFASKSVYDTWWFYVLQAGIALSLALAVLDRLPLRRRLSGFYIVHAAILTMMAGYLITHFYGVDGSLELRENEFRSGLALHEDMIALQTDDERLETELPPASSPVRMNESLRFKDGTKVEVLEYLPYAHEKSDWAKQDGAWSSVWTLDNGRFRQNLTLVRGGSEAGQAQVDLGPLTVRAVEADYLNKLAASGAEARYALHDERTGETFFVPATSHWTAAANSKFRFRVVNDPRLSLTYIEVLAPEGILKFFPRFSSRPVNGHLAVDEKSPYRLNDLGGSATKKSVLVTLDGEVVKIAFPENGVWRTKTPSGAPVSLPWMGFKLSLNDSRPGQIPRPAFAPATPNKDEQKNTKAVRLRVQNHFREEEIWINNRTPSVFNGRVEGMIAAREIQLPFGLALEKFHMDKIPGTERPASFESFVKIKGENEGAHIFMNHPLKRDGYTFYQASYLQDEEGKFHSILSVNKDPGRPVKYAGSMLLVLGLVFHFLIIYGYLFAPQRRSE